MSDYVKANPSAPILNGASYIKPKPCNNYTGVLQKVFADTEQFTDLSAHSAELNTVGRFHDGPWDEQFANSGTVVSGTGDVSKYFAALTRQAHVLEDTIYWSHDGDYTGSGYLQVESPSGNVIFGPQYITSAGPGYFPLGDGLIGEDGEDMFVVLTNPSQEGNGSLTMFHKLC